MNQREPFVPEHDQPILYPVKINKAYPWLVAGFSTREQGESTGPFSSLNVGLHVGDRLDHVLENRKKIILSQGFLVEQWVSANQVHGANLYQVTAQDRGKGYVSLETAIPGTDGLFTKEKGIFLVSFYADCVPLYFIDIRQRIIGICHAGWRGTASQIGSRLIERWQKTFGSHLADIRVLIGPAIGPCCYEVDERVINHFTQFSKEISPASVQEKGNNKYMLDLKQINVDLLVQAGVKEEHIEVSHWCTSCHPEFFFSHRRDKGKTGRMMAFIGIKEDVET